MLPTSGAVPGYEGAPNARKMAIDHFGGEVTGAVFHIDNQSRTRVKLEPERRRNMCDVWDARDPDGGADPRRIKTRDPDFGRYRLNLFSRHDGELSGISDFSPFGY
jgi:hypothetical protein